MMKKLFLPILLVCIVPAWGQKKVDPVSQSAMSGITLPANSKQDKRFLMVTAARVLLEMESKKAGTDIGPVEILYLPPVAVSQFNADALVDQLAQQGWNLYPVEGDDKFVWLEKEGRYLMAYFSMDKKESSLYFGEPTQAPALNVAPMEVNDPGTGGGGMENIPANENPVNNEPVQNTVPPANNEPAPTQEPVSTPTSDGQTLNNSGFTETRFDNGWVSTAKEDWVEVVKGSVKILLHYPNPNVQSPNTDIDKMCAAAWNTLVAPRYSQIQNYQVGPNMLDYERAYFCQAYLTENSTGRQVFVALFKKGNTVWMEVVTPDEATFAREFGFNIVGLQNAELNVWDKLKVMNNYNRFGVKEHELRGLWADHFSSNTFYTNVYTGASAGMSTYSSSQEFNFTGPGTYKWNLVAANSYGGQTQFASAKSEGQFKMVNDWQIWFSDIERKPRKYDAYFSYIKGGKVLWLNDAEYAGSGIFTGYMKK